MLHQSNNLESIDNPFVLDHRYIDNADNHIIGKEIQFTSTIHHGAMAEQDCYYCNSLQDNDVICGKGRLVHSHPGNKQFRRLIHFRRESYQTAHLRDDKKQITNSVIEAIHRLGGRFVKMDESGQYTQVSDEYQYEKVSHALRAAKKSPSSHSSRTPSYGSVLLPPPDLNRGSTIATFDFQDLKQQQVSRLRTISDDSKSNDAFASDSFASQSTFQDTISENDTSLEPIDIYSADSDLVNEDVLALLQPTFERRHSHHYRISSDDECDHTFASSKFDVYYRLDAINNLTAEPVAVDEDVLEVLLQL
jgi:hypothetical protein